MRDLLVSVSEVQQRAEHTQSVPRHTGQTANEAPTQVTEVLKVLTEAVGMTALLALPYCWVFNSCSFADHNVMADSHRGSGRSQGTVDNLISFNPPEHPVRTT